jgi:hypothetical protein
MDSEVAVLATGFIASVLLYGTLLVRAQGPTPSRTSAGSHVVNRRSVQSGDR